MLSRTNRLYTKHVDAVMEKGRVVHSSLFLLRSLAGQIDTRIGVVAPRKTVKKAVDRNKIRRIVYHAVRPLTQKGITGNHIVIIAKPAVLDMSVQDVHTELQSLFVKARLLR